jgi:AcrR family transcriptional regulator
MEANLANIVKDSNISRGSLYQYFEDKEDLYEYIFDRLRAQRSEYVKPSYDGYKKKPFLDFFQEFYLLDSKFLIEHPSHIELGKMLYSGSDNTSRGLIHRLQARYKESFLLAIEHDKDRGIIDRQVSSSALADLCVHFVTDMFIFQSIHTQFSLMNIKEHCAQTMDIIRLGVYPRN